MLISIFREIAARLRREPQHASAPEHRLPLPESDLLGFDAGAREALQRAVELYHRGDFAAAQAALERLCAAGHDGALVQALLAMARLAQGDEPAARAAFAAAAGHDGQLLRRVVDEAKRSRKRQDGDAAALGACLMAAGLAPDSAPLAAQAADLYYLTGHPEKALPWLERAYRASGRDALRVKHVLMRLPPILRSHAHLESTRSSYIEGLRELAASPLRIADPAEEINITNFYLAFQGRNEREPQELLARVMLAASSMLGYVAPHCRAPLAPRERLRVGFVSSYLGRSHSVAVAWARMVQALGERGDFEVSVIAPGETLPKNLAAAQQALGERALDVVVHTDIGMDPFTYFLAFGRYAPLQVALGGHPVTTGIPNVDAYVSGSLLEPEGAQAHYSERLVLLPGLHWTKAPPPRLPALEREALGLDPRRHLYVCPMKLQKLHPDFDAALRGILEADRDADIVLFEERSTPAWNATLRERLARSLGAGAARVLFEPWAEFSRFMRILGAADVVLDSFHFGGGITAFEALGAGCPVVTLPSQFARGRSSLAAYLKMGITECVASDARDYVRIAITLAGDKRRQADLRARLLAASPALFERGGPTATFGEALHALYRELATGKSLGLSRRQ
jgi:protein O-GlcNAc transferase